MQNVLEGQFSELLSRPRESAFLHLKLNFSGATMQINQPILLASHSIYGWLVLVRI